MNSQIFEEIIGEFSPSIEKSRDDATFFGNVAHDVHFNDFPEMLGAADAAGLGTIRQVLE